MMLRGINRIIVTESVLERSSEVKKTKILKSSNVILKIQELN